MTHRVPAVPARKRKANVLFDQEEDDAEVQQRAPDKKKPKKQGPGKSATPEEETDLVERLRECIVKHGLQV